MRMSSYITKEELIAALEGDTAQKLADYLNRIVKKRDILTEKEIITFHQLIYSLEKDRQFSEQTMLGQILDDRDSLRADGDVFEAILSSRYKELITRFSEDLLTRERIIKHFQDLNRATKYELNDTHLIANRKDYKELEFLHYLNKRTPETITPKRLSEMETTLENSFNADVFERWKKLYLILIQGATYFESSEGGEVFFLGSGSRTAQKILWSYVEDSFLKELKDCINYWNLNDPEIKSSIESFNKEVEDFYSEMLPQYEMIDDKFPEVVESTVAFITQTLSRHENPKQSQKRQIDEMLML
ncbi:hypothetical protein ACMXYX_18105 (plasmid) [Neptuniibacter sp. QD72_48]|uniref:hypothetical protein n=1 Tax=Neptuniibacter sp. QD72_48 TaxID=3398214 RepID=UPI0039F5DDF3